MGTGEEAEMTQDWDPKVHGTGPFSDNWSDTAMTTDLSNKKVEELLELIDADWNTGPLKAGKELARRLEEAQKLLHDLPRLIEFYEKHAVGPKAAPSCLICGKQPIEVGIRHLELPEIVVCKTCIKAQQQLDRYTRRSESGESLADHYDTLDALQEAQQRNAAHDAKVAAEAKAEALEEAKALVLKRGEQIGGAIDPKRTAIELGIKAVEYRAKATEAGRKE